MCAAEFVKHFVARPSTRRRLGDIIQGISNLQHDLKNEFRGKRKLKNYCHGRTDILLNIGCGDLIQKGWINIDHYPRRPEAFYFNVLNPLPIDDQTVAHINAEHFLEHMEYSDAVTFLGECHRILKTSGTMRIVVPDAERYMRAYVVNDATFFENLKDLGGTREFLPTKDAICNQMFRMNGFHRFAWDFETLEYVTRQIGFTAIRKSHHNDSLSPHCIDGQDWWRPVESLYVNLIK